MRNSTRDGAEQFESNICLHGGKHEPTGRNGALKRITRTLRSIQAITGDYERRHSSEAGNGPGPSNVHALGPIGRRELSRCWIYALSVTPLV